MFFPKIYPEVVIVYPEEPDSYLYAVWDLSIINIIFFIIVFMYASI